MDDFNTVYALLVLVMLFILLSRLDNRFGKIEKELNEIKKRMEDYLKVQQNSVAEASKPKEEISGFSAGMVKGSGLCRTGLYDGNSSNQEIWFSFWLVLPPNVWE